MKKKRAKRILALITALALVLPSVFAWSFAEPAESAVVDTADEISEYGENIPTDEEATQNEALDTDAPANDETEVETLSDEAPPLYENSVQSTIANSGYAYVMTTSEVGICTAVDMSEFVYVIQSGAALLVTDCIESEYGSLVKVWFVTQDPYIILTGYALRAAFHDEALSVDDVYSMTDTIPWAMASTEDGELLVLVAQGYDPNVSSVEPDMPDAPPEENINETQTPSEAPTENPATITPESTEQPPVVLPQAPAVEPSAEPMEPTEPIEPAATEEAQAQEEPTETEEPIENEESFPKQVGEYVSVTTATRVFEAIDDTATDDDIGDLFLGYFVNDATVQIESVEQDEMSRYWYRVCYLYGDDFVDGTLKWTEQATIYVLASETQDTTDQSLTVTDYALPYPPTSDIMLMSATPMNGFSLKTINASVPSLRVGQSGLYGSSGKDSDYLQIAKDPDHGTIYATPHYLNGYTVYCLEHNLSGPGESISGGGQQPTGPYVIVDIDSYRNNPGYSSIIYHDSTMHAIGWVLRHTYPFMALDRSDSDNLTWSRVAGQFAIRQVIRELEGAQYVRSYWDMDNFYRASGQAPAVYLDYARWLAANGIARASMTGRINATNQATSYANGTITGTVKLTTDADLIRIRKSVGTLTGNTAGQDSTYYYLKSGDTVTISATGNKLTVVAESVSSADEEANFLVGVPSVAIQKVLIPQYGAPYQLRSLSLTFDMPLGSISVTKKGADSGAVLAGAVFELLSSTGTVLQTKTTGTNGIVTFQSLEPGAYTIREKTAPEGYVLSEVTTQNVTVIGGQTSSSVVFENERIQGTLKIVKADAQTGEPVLLAGTAFMLKDAQGNIVKQKTDALTQTDTFYTNENGEVTLPEPLPYGQYYVSEVQAPDGYLLGSQEIPVFVGRDGSTEVMVEVSNDPVKGRVSLQKKGLQLVGFDAMLDAYGNEIHHPRYEEAYLANAVFELYAAEDIIGKDGTVWYKADELVDTITTTASGADTSKELPLGDYYLVETQAPDGYALDSTRHEVTLSYADSQTPIIDITVEATNEYLPAEIILRKEKESLQVVTHEDGMVEQSIQNMAGDGFVFGLYNAEAISFQGGSLKADTLIATGVTDENGELVLADSYPHGEYYLREIAAPAGWKLTEERFPISVDPTAKNDGNIISVELPNPIHNELIHADVTLTKTDITGQQPLPGALIEVRNEADELIYRARTDANGQLPDIPVTPGKYTFKEVLAPSGYALNTAVMRFEVDANGHVTGETEIRDDYTRFALRKQDENGFPLADVTFTLTQDNSSLFFTAISDENGLVTFEEIPYGDYTLTESKPLPGYLQNDTTIHLSINGTYVNPSEPIATLINHPNQIILHKVDNRDNPLSGAVFGLFNEAGEQIVEATSDDEGIATFTRLAAGNYIIRETQAPDGYTPMQDMELYVDEGWTEPVQYTCVNHPIDETPDIQTGVDVEITLAMCVGIGLVLAGIALLLGYAAVRKRKAQKRRR